MGSTGKLQVRRISGVFALLVGLATASSATAQGDPNLGSAARVGFEIDKTGDVVVIKKIIEGTSAEDAGLKIGDQVLRVDHRNVIDMSVRKVEPMLRGPEGSSVQITVLPRMEMLPRTLTILRDADDDAVVEGPGSATDAIRRMAKATRERTTRSGIQVDRIEFLSKGQPEEALRDAIATRVKDVDQCARAVDGFPTADDGKFKVKFSLKGNGYVGVRVQPVDIDVQVCIAAKAANWSLPTPKKPPAEFRVHYSAAPETPAPPSPGTQSTP